MRHCVVLNKNSETGAAAIREMGMNRRTFIEIAGSCVALTQSPLAWTSRSMADISSSPADRDSTEVPTGPASPFNVDNKTQLFVDQVLVRETRGVSFSLHPAAKHAANPLIKADRPWEGWRIELYGSVLFDKDENLFKMWYQACESPDFTNGFAACYATSTDGIHWEKPLVGTVKAKTSKQHNAVLDACILPTVIKDKNDPAPSRRYKMICWLQKKTSEGWAGYHTFVSPDGLQWTQLSKKAICRGGDVITGYYDEARMLYVAFPKIETPVRGHNRRAFYVITSRDFESWSDPELVWSPDLRDDAGSLARLERVRPVLDVPDSPALMRTEFYGIGAYQHESCALAFPWIFTINNNARYGNHEGPFELQLGVSRDLKNWERPFRVPCLPYGELGEWDRGIVVTPAEAIRVGDEILLYYGGANYTHGTPALYRAEGTERGTRYAGSIGLAKWKLDRFVSADASKGGGVLRTVPIVFSGAELLINAAVKRDGQITVRPLTADGQSLPGYGASLPFRADGLRETIRWPNGTTIAPLKGRAISLEFSLRSAELYSFAFKG
jgi:hypothetical protein